MQARSHGIKCVLVHAQVIAWVVLAGTAAFEVLQAHLAGAPVSTLPAWLALAAIPVSLYSLAEVRAC